MPSPSIAFALALYVAGIQENWADFAFGEWHQVIAVYDAGAQRLYLGGQLFAEGTTSQRMTDTDGGAIHIGFSGIGPDEYSVGAIGDVLLYDVALTPDEAMALYHP